MIREEFMNNIVFSQKRWNSSALDKIEGYVNKIYDEHEAQLKAKDEEIAELKSRAYFAEGYISDLHNEYPKNKKFLDRKARSIVAMLFWEWREADTSYVNSRTEKPKPTEKTISLRGMKASQCERLFKQAYKMLKSNQCG